MNYRVFLAAKSGERCGRRSHDLFEKSAGAHSRRKCSVVLLQKVPIWQAFPVLLSQLPQLNAEGDTPRLVERGGRFNAVCMTSSARKFAPQTGACPKKHDCSLGEVGRKGGATQEAGHPEA